MHLETLCSKNINLALRKYVQPNPTSIYVSELAVALRYIFSLVQLSGGGSVPSVTMVDSTGSVLTWTHRLEYTDTGTYVCLVREPATERLSSATVNLTVLRE